MKLSLPPETYALVAVATADVVITLTTTGFEGLAHVLRSKIACTTLVLIVLRCVLSVLTARVTTCSYPSLNPRQLRLATLVGLRDAACLWTFVANRIISWVWSPMVPRVVISTASRRSAT